jgi:hypothetical protein
MYRRSEHASLTTQTVEFRPYRVAPRSRPTCSASSVCGPRPRTPVARSVPHRSRRPGAASLGREHAPFTGRQPPSDCHSSHKRRCGRAAVSVRSRRLPVTLGGPGPPRTTYSRELTPSRFHRLYAVQSPGEGWSPCKRATSSAESSTPRSPGESAPSGSPSSIARPRRWECSLPPRCGEYRRCSHPRGCTPFASRRGTACSRSPPWSSRTATSGRTTKSRSASRSLWTAPSSRSPSSSVADRRICICTSIACR